MRLEQLQYFEKVYKEKSMVRAAEKLFISQPALSIAISNLEKELGVTLFERTRNGIVPTTFGEKLIEPVCEIQKNLDSIYAIINKKHEELHIIVEPMTLVKLISNVLGLYKDDFGQVNIRLTEENHAKKQNIIFDTTERERWVCLSVLLKEDLKRLERENRRLQREVVFLGKQKLYVVAHKNMFPNLHGITMKECLRYNLLLGEDSLNIFKLLWRKHGLAEKYMVIDTFEMMERMLMEQVGITIMPEITFRNHSELIAGNLKLLELEDYEDVFLDYYLIASNNFGANECERKFKEHVIRIFQENVI